MAEDESESKSSSSIFRGLESKVEDKVDLDLLRRCQAVGIFYSKNSDEECRRFIPVLKGFYHRINKKGFKFEVVFVSADDFEQAVLVTAEKLRFPFFPLKRVPRAIEKLKQRYGFNEKELPKLLIIDPVTGSLITQFGVERIFDDPNGKFFPWKARLSQSIGNEFINGMDKPAIVNFVAYSKNPRNTYNIAFFLATYENHHIISLVQQIHAQICSKCFVIIVGMDEWGYQFQKWVDSFKIENKKQADKWLKIPFAEGPRRQGIMDSLKVRELPALVLLDSQFNIVHPNALQAAILDPLCTNFPWSLDEYPETLPDLTIFKPKEPVDDSVPEEHKKIVENFQNSKDQAEELMSLEAAEGADLEEKLKKVRKHGVLTLKRQFDLNEAKSIYLGDGGQDDHGAATVEDGVAKTSNSKDRSKDLPRSSVVLNGPKLNRPNTSYH